MPKLSEKEAFEKTINTFRFVVTEKKKRPYMRVYDLKCEYMERFRVKHKPLFECYFCEYAYQRRGQIISDFRGNKCPACPAAKADGKGNRYYETVWCEQKTHDYQDKPEAFLAKIEALYETWKEQQ